MLIPQRTNPNIPRKARTPTYLCQERYGLIWVALAEPIVDLPEIPEFIDLKSNSGLG